MLTDRDEHMWTPVEVARLFRVDPKTVGRWADAGRIPSVRTFGGHRRFYPDDVRALLRGGAQPEVSGRRGWELPRLPLHSALPGAERANRLF